MSEYLIECLERISNNNNNKNSNTIQEVNKKLDDDIEEKTIKVLNEIKDTYKRISREKNESEERKDKIINNKANLFEIAKEISYQSGKKISTISRDISHEQTKKSGKKDILENIILNFIQQGINNSFDIYVKINKDYLHRTIIDLIDSRDYFKMTKESTIKARLSELDEDDIIYVYDISKDITGELINCYKINPNQPNPELKRKLKEEKRLEKHANRILN